MPSSAGGRRLPAVTEAAEKLGALHLPVQPGLPPPVRADAN